MYGGLFNIVFTDYAGGVADLYFLEQAGWLNDAAVAAHVYSRQGRWKVVLSFAWMANPYRFVCRYITESFDTEKKAALYADFYKRTSQKDKRGTITLSVNDFMHCFN